MGRCFSLQRRCFWGRGGRLFCPATADDEQRDDVLRRKLALLRWVREEHLDINVTEFNDVYIHNAADGRSAVQPALMAATHILDASMYLTIATSGDIATDGGRRPSRSWQSCSSLTSTRHHGIR